MSHGEREHAPFSPSGAERWLNCPMAVRYAEKLPPSETSKHSDYGTRCHELAEAYLRGDWGRTPGTLLGEALDAATGWVTEWGQVDRMPSEVAAEMVGVVAPYVEYVNARTVDGCTRRIEERVAVAGKDCWGSLDCSILTAFDTLWIIDLKGGSGKCVDAAENEQLLTYAAGEAERNDYAFEKVCLVIVQPRRTDGKPIIDEWWTTPDVIRTHLKRIKKAIKATQAINAEPAAGDWCNWCVAKALCPAQRKQALACLGSDPGEASILTLPDPGALQPGQLSRILQSRKSIERWLKSCGALALTQPPPGWKVVAGSSKRRWALSAEALDAALGLEGIDAAPFLRQAPVSVTEATALFKKLGRVDLSTAVFEKPAGKPTIATLDDKRPAIDALSALPDLGEDDDE
jgi:hypothetical protein